MRGYQTLGKRLVHIHETGKDEKEIVRSVYKVYGRNRHIVRYQKLWREVELKDGIVHLTIKTHN